MALAQSKQISSFNFGEPNMFDCFRQIVPFNLRMTSSPFWREMQMKTLQARQVDLLVARSSTLHPKNYTSFAKTFSPGILLRLICGKSMAWYIIVMQPFLVVYRGISHLSLVFSWYKHLRSPQRLISIHVPRKYK